MMKAQLSGTWQPLAWMVLLGVLVGCSGESFEARAQEPAAKAPANRLAKESSPYLLLHAHNPVDWYPWGPEAFAKAKKENKLIFLSIGYSSCYWCHVMERLVFQNEQIARYMNENFVNIKVDREERPDVDEIYMTSLQVYYQAIGVSQSVGWPLSMFLTPDLKPLGGGTYFPPEDKDGRTGFPTVLKSIQTAWTESPDNLRESANTLSRAVKQTVRGRPNLIPVKLEDRLATVAVDELKATFDTEAGGFDFNPAQPDRPKFPVPVKLSLLQQQRELNPQDDCGKMLTLTLDRLAAGGIHDHLGGGFHRYSTDRYWRVPHFEKMLYDNAQLADVYVTAYQATQQSEYRAVAEGIFEFVRREMTDEKGGFYSALDAETDGVEGQYYVWTREQVAETLRPEDVRLLGQHFGMDREPNFEKAYVLEVTRSVKALAEGLQLEPAEAERRLEAAKAELLAARQKRTPLLRDDKVLTSWNGLMIKALAHGAVVFDRPEYLQAAEKAAMFILTQMRDDKGRLLRTYRKDVAKIPAYLDDYAFLIEGLLALQSASGDEKWLNAAIRLQEQQDQLFWDAEQQGYYFTATDHEELLIRVKDMHDSVLPSGNSVSARNLVRLARETQKETYRKAAGETLTACANVLRDTPRSAVNLAIALREYLQLEAPAQSGEKVQKGAGQRSPVTPQAFAQVGDEAPPPPARKKLPEHVKGKVLLNVDKLPPGKQCEFVIILNIDEGWHINPNPAPDEFTPATELTVKSKLNVTELEVTFPEAEEHDVPGTQKKAYYYTGRIEIRGLLEVPADAAGKAEDLEFRVKYQACNEETCLRPMTLSLKHAVPVAKPGEKIKRINAKLFDPPQE